MVSCSGRQDSQTKQAGEWHLKSLSVLNQLEERLANDSVKMPKDSVIQIQSALREWESELVEVPGLEHHHHSGHAHDHTTPKLTQQQMLEIQIELYKRIKSIENRYNKIKKNIK